MATTKTMEDGEVRKLVKWPSGRRNGGARRWKKRWLIVKAAPRKKSA